MKISVIGSGNVATHFARAMYQRGHSIDQVWSRSLAHAQLLADKVEAEPINDFSQLRLQSAVFIMAISDDALHEVAPILHLGDALVLHTSGATSIEVLHSTSSRYGVLWSPQTFIRDVALNYSELPFCIEGNTLQTENDIEELVGGVSDHIYHTNQEQRRYLHLSAVMVNNFTNCLYGMAQQLCDEHGVPFEILYPIITTTAQKVQLGDVRYQMTGPAIRKDEKTLDAHRALLADDPQLLKLYNELTHLIQNRLEVK